MFLFSNYVSDLFTVTCDHALSEKKVKTNGSSRSGQWYRSRCLKIFHCLNSLTTA